MEEYPLILRPHLIQLVQEEYPPEPSLVLVEEPVKPTILAKPKKPKEIKPTPPKRINYLYLFISEIISAVISGTIAIATQNQNLGFILFIVFTLGVIGWGWWQQNSYPDRLEEYRRNQREFKEVWEEYHKSKNQWQAKRLLLLEQYEQQREDTRKENEGLRKQHRQELVREAMKQLNPSYDDNGSNAKKGHSEENFASYLFNYFSQNIHQEIVIQNPDYDKGFHYTADFAYINKELKIYIDIEIDEPYAYKSRKPLHYIDSDTDLRRNECFLERDWFIIRFSEEQIVKSPENCCRTIAELIAEIKGLESIPYKLKHIEPVKKKSRWSEEEARRMTDENYRQTYLKKHKI